jgi:hypothetical protein
MVKGAAVRELLAWSLERLAPGTGERMIGRMRPEDRALLVPDAPALGIRGSKWYPSPLVHSVLDVFAESVGGEAQHGFMRDACAAVIPRMVAGPYRALFGLLASPSLYARLIQHGWRQLHTTGQRSMVLPRPGEAESQINNWSGHHPILCEVTVETMATLFRVMLRSDIQVQRVACVSEGAPCCRALLRWSSAG